MKAQSGDPILVQRDVEPAVDVMAGGEDLRAVAPHAPCPSLPRRHRRTGATTEGVPMNAVLVIPEVGLRVVARPESAEDAHLASSPGAEGVRGERGQQRMSWERRQRRLREHTGDVSSHSVST